MYLDHFGLQEEPFKLTPDPKYFYTSDQHLEVLSCLQYTIEYKKGFGVLIGEAGSGKTTVGHVLLSRLDPSTKVAMITNTHLDGRELVYTILREFGEDVDLDDKCVLLSKLNDCLIRELARGGNPVLLVDEAQNLHPKVLEEIRMLANLETESEKLLQIILMGQPELEKMLGGNRFTQLQQRFAVGVRLTRFDRQDTGEFIKHRMRTAGAQDDIFTEDAIDVIYDETKGVPRLISNICDACLVNAYAIGLGYVDSGIVRETVEERNKLFETGSDDAIAIEKLYEKRLSDTRSDGRNISKPTPEEGDGANLRTRDERCRSRSASTQTDVSQKLARTDGMTRQQVAETTEKGDELKMWLDRAFGVDDSEEFLGSEDFLEVGELKIMSHPSGDGMIGDLLLNYKARQSQRLAHREMLNRPRLSAAAPLKRETSSRRKGQVTKKKRRTSHSASRPFVAKSCDLKRKKSFKRSDPAEALFEDEELVMSSGEEL